MIKNAIAKEILTTPFKNEIGIYQDGTLPFLRLEDGNLVTLSGHSHMGHIGFFKGTDINDMKEVKPIALNFTVGHMDYAFDKVKYPEGIKSRGSVWPFGLYESKETKRIFAFFHNETGWNGKNTGYDAKGYVENDNPWFDTDFRHIGLMHSDDYGINWTFDRWVLTSNEVCASSRFIPENENIKGQDMENYKPLVTGSGDFTLFDDPKSEYIYLFYNIIHTIPEKSMWDSCHTYIARTRKRNDGVMPDFVKYYNGEFNEPGNLGMESPIVLNSWHSNVVYSKKHDLYIMASNIVDSYKETFILRECLELRTSKDLIHWSEPFIPHFSDGTEVRSHYFGMNPVDLKGNPNVIEEDVIDVLLSGEAKDVRRVRISLEIE